jgi:hypothetical protein
MGWPLASDADARATRDRASRQDPPVTAPGQRIEERRQSIDFIHGVVVGHTHPHHSVVTGQTECVDESGRIEVSVADTDLMLINSADNLGTRYTVDYE